MALSDAGGIEVMVANPRAVRNFAKAMMPRSKSDRLDAVVLRELGARMRFKRLLADASVGATPIACVEALA